MELIEFIRNEIQKQLSVDEAKGDIKIERLLAFGKYQTINHNFKNLKQAFDFVDKSIKRVMKKNKKVEKDLRPGAYGKQQEPTYKINGKYYQSKYSNVDFSKHVPKNQIISRADESVNEDLPTREIDPSKFPNPLGSKKGFLKKGNYDGDKTDDVVSTKPVSISVSQLKPSQDAIYLGKALGLAVGGVEGGDLGAVISKDNYILDGHHRYAATTFNNPSAKVGGVQSDLVIGDLVPVLRAVGDAMKNRRGVAPSGGDINIFKATMDDVTAAIYDGKNMDSKFYNKEKSIKWFESIGEKTIAKRLKMIQSKRPPSGAPGRKDMPKLHPNQLGILKTLLNKGNVDVRKPYTESVNEGKSTYSIEQLADMVKAYKKRGTELPLDVYIHHGSSMGGTYSEWKVLPSHIEKALKSGAISNAVTKLAKALKVRGHTIIRRQKESVNEGKLPIDYNKKEENQWRKIEALIKKIDTEKKAKDFIEEYANYVEKLYRGERNYENLVPNAVNVIANHVQEFPDEYPLSDDIWWKVTNVKVRQMGKNYLKGKHFVESVDEAKKSLATKMALQESRNYYVDIYDVDEDAEDYLKDDVKSFGGEFGWSQLNDNGRYYTLRFYFGDERKAMKFVSYMNRNGEMTSKAMRNESTNEETKRDYKKEYAKYGKSKKAKKYRAELNKYNRDKGTYGNGDGKDASHKGGKIVGFESESKNRGRREKSRLKKESVNEAIGFSWLIYTLLGYILFSVVDIADTPAELTFGKGSRSRFLIDKFKKILKNRKVKTIVDKLKTDPEVIDYAKKRKPGWRKMLANKLDAKDKKLLNNIYRTHFNKKEVEESIKENMKLNEAMSQDAKFKIYDKLKKGDKITIKYDSSVKRGHETTFVVSKGKTKVGKARVERIILKNMANPKGVKYYLYNRNGNVSLAMGNMATSIVDISESVNENKKYQNMIDKAMRKSDHMATVAKVIMKVSKKLGLDSKKYFDTKRNTIDYEQFIDDATEKDSTNEQGLTFHKSAFGESVNEEQLDEKLITFSNRAPYGQIVFMAGGAGSGKGFAISNFVDSSSFRIRDVDEMKKQLGKLEQMGKISVDSWYKQYGKNLKPREDAHIKKHVLNKGMSISDLSANMKNPDNVSSLHYIVDSMGLKHRWVFNMLQGKSNKETLPNLLFDMTAQNIGRVKELLNPLVAAGYDSKNIHLVWVLTNYVAAIEQNKTRDRVVPEDVLLLTHEGATETIWSMLTKSLPKGINGRIDVILNNRKNTVMWRVGDTLKTQRRKNTKGKVIKARPIKSDPDQKFVVRGFVSLPVKKQGGGIVPESRWKVILHSWIMKNAPKTINLNKPLGEQMKSVNEYGLSHDDIFDMLDIAAMYSSTQHQAANQSWGDAQDLYDYLKSDHIPRKYHKDFYKDVKKSYPKVNESVNEGKIDLNKVRDTLENEYDWTYVEQEGNSSVRFDYGDNSMWVNSDGTVSGNVPTKGSDAKYVKKALKKLGIKESVKEETNMKQRVNEASYPFVVFYGGKEYEVKGQNKFDAKEKAIKALKIPHLKQKKVIVKSTIEVQLSKDFKKSGGPRRLKLKELMESPRISNLTEKQKEVLLKTIGESVNEGEYIPEKEAEAIKKWVYDNGYDASVVMLSDLWSSKAQLVKRILADVPKKDHKNLIKGLKKAGLYESVTEASDSMLQFVRDEASGGMIGSATGMTRYKDIDKIRELMIHMLQKKDVKYSLDNFKKLAKTVSKFMSGKRESVNESEIPKSELKMLGKVLKLAKKHGFKTIKNPEQWIKKNGYYESGITTVALFLHPDEDNDFGFVQVYHEESEPEYLNVHFYAWGSSGNDSIDDWTTDRYWKDYFSEEDFDESVNEAVVKVSKEDDYLGNMLKLKGERKIKALVVSGSTGMPELGSYEIKGNKLNVIGIRPRDKWMFVNFFTKGTGIRKSNLYYDGVHWESGKKFESVNEAKSTKKGNTYYVDSDFVNLSKKGGKLKHLGMGDFAVDVKGGGTISFHRVSEKMSGFSGRTHRVVGSDDDFKKLTKLMGVNPNEALSPSDRKKKWAKRDSKKARRAKGKKLTKRELELTKKESVNEDKERKLDDLLFSKGYDVWGGNTAAKRYWKRNGLVIEVSHKNGRNKYHVDYKLNVTPLERLSETSIKDAIKYAKEIETKIRK